MAIAITLSNGRTWRTKAAALSHFKAMLARHTDGAVVEDSNDHEDLVALPERYDEAITDGPSKTGMGIDHFTRTRNMKSAYPVARVSAGHCPSIGIQAGFNQSDYRVDGIGSHAFVRCYALH